MKKTAKHYRQTKCVMELQEDHREVDAECSLFLDGEAVSFGLTFRSVSGEAA